MFLKRIKDVREEYDLTGIALAKILGVSKSNYSRWETDENLIPLNHLNDLCNYFKISMDYITGLSNKRNYKNINTELDKKKIGKRIKQFRNDKGLTQEKLASVLNTCHSTISSYENGKTMILTAFAFEICTKFNMSLDYLVGRIDDNPKK